jgi:predicted secreted protein
VDSLTKGRSFTSNDKAFRTRNHRSRFRRGDHRIGRNFQRHADRHRHRRELDQPDRGIAGGTTSGTGTAAATSALGSISKYGSAPTGFTLARGASNWTLSSTVGLQVYKANLTSTDYTLTAQLGSAPASGVAWKLNGSTLSDSAATTLTSTGTYGSTGSYSWDIVVADSAAAAAIDNAINFTATSN